MNERPSPIRICLIGNSHVGCARVAWRQIRDKYPAFDIAFFGAPTRIMSDVSVEGGVIRARSAEARTTLLKISGVSEVDLRLFDIVGLVGLGLAPSIVVRLFSKFRPWAADRTVGKSRWLSTAAFEAAIEGAMLQTFSYGLARSIRGQTSGRVLVVPQPCPTEGVLSYGDAGKVDAVPALWWTLAVRACGEELYRHFVSAARRVSGELDVEFVEQVSSTIVSGILTRDEYRLHDPSEKADFAHMNWEYGELLCRSILATAVRPAPDSAFPLESLTLRPARESKRAVAAAAGHN